MIAVGFDDKTAYAQCIFAYTPGEVRALTDKGDRGCGAM